MSELDSGWTYTGVAVAIISALATLLRSLRKSPAASPSLPRKAFQLGAAVWRLQVAEGSLAAAKEYAISEQVEKLRIMEELLNERRESHALRAEIATLRAEIRVLTGSRTQP